MANENFVPFPPEPPFGHAKIEELVSFIRPLRPDGRPLEGTELRADLYVKLAHRWGLQKRDAFKSDSWILHGKDSRSKGSRLPEEYILQLLLLSLEGVRDQDIAIAIGVHARDVADLETDATDIPTANAISNIKNRFFSPLVMSIAKYVRERGKKIHALIFPQYDPATHQETDASVKIEHMRKALGLTHRSQLFDLSARWLPAPDGVGFAQIDTAVDALYRVIVRGEAAMTVDKDIRGRLSEPSPGQDQRTYRNDRFHNVTVLANMCLSGEAKAAFLKLKANK